MTAATSYPSRVLAGVMSEAEFFGFLATYAVPEDRGNPIDALRQRWRESRAALAAWPAHEPAQAEDWDPAWGDPRALEDRPGVSALRRQHPDAAFCSAPVSALVAVHPSLDLDQVEYWASRLGAGGGLAAPESNVAPVGFHLLEDSRAVEVRAAYALLGAYFTAEASPETPLPHVGLHWQPGLNLIQVGHLGDRLVLINGHHRAFAIARAGAARIPCITYAVEDLAVVGVSSGGATDAGIRSERPPLLAHYLDPRIAVAVQLRRSTRVVRLSISEETVQERS
ncbi:MAG: hypothetical protein FJZ01_22440 [Candidatus Sericytochromatia bacterium]|nr:hypothetical protein [Candidatus Tanganyikabacteria bacterium]